MKAISYSLFGYSKTTPKNCFEFNTYLRGLMVNVRINRIVYPDWINVINIDTSTYESKYKPLFDWLQEKELIDINLCPDNAPLCIAMLWRLQPVFFELDGKWGYSHVLCRDIDSVCTYREAQAVQQWIDEDKTIHCITDSISHNIPMMGGMIGIRPDHFSARLKVNGWAQLLERANGIDFNQKGADQRFLQQYIYPACAESSTEHFIKGMPHNLAEGNGRHYSIDTNIKIPVNEEFRIIDTTCGHIGSAGYYEPPMVKFLMTQDPYRDEYKEIEKQFTQIFYWQG